MGQIINHRGFLRENKLPSVMSDELPSYELRMNAVVHTYTRYKGGQQAVAEKFLLSQLRDYQLPVPGYIHCRQDTGTVVAAIFFKSAVHIFIFK